MTVNILPSGKDKEYGYCMHYSTVDNGDFTVAFFAKGNPFGLIENDNFYWIVEHKSGEQVFMSERVPNWRPILGLDSREWDSFKEESLGYINAYIEKQTKGEGDMSVDVSNKIVIHTDIYGDRIEIDTEVCEEGVYMRISERNVDFCEYTTPCVKLNVKQVKAKAIRKQLKQWLIENGHKEGK